MGRMTTIAAAGTLLIAALALPVTAQEPAEAPAPFETYAVYTAAGVYDASVPPAEGDLAAWFHGEIMGRDEEALGEERDRADAYFSETFGELYTPGSLEAFGLDPRNEYRVYFLSGEDVPPEGWVVRDGGLRADLSDGGFVVFGDYNIAVTSSDGGEDREPIVIHYESTHPIYPQDDGSLLFRCRLTSDDFGGGLAQGISDPQTLSDGRTVANIRNILTFPGLGTAATPSS